MNTKRLMAALACLLLAGTAGAWAQQEVRRNKTNDEGGREAYRAVIDKDGNIHKTRVRENDDGSINVTKKGLDADGDARKAAASNESGGLARAKGINKAGGDKVRFVDAENPNKDRFRGRGRDWADGRRDRAKGKDAVNDDRWRKRGLKGDKGTFRRGLEEQKGQSPRRKSFRTGGHSQIKGGNERAGNRSRVRGPRVNRKRPN